MAKTSLPNDSREYQDQHYDPAQDFYDREFNQLAKHYDEEADHPLGDSEAKSADPGSIARAEKSEQEKVDNQFGYSPSDKSTKAQKTFFQRISKKKAMIGGGITGAIIALVIALINISPFGVFIQAKETFSNWGGNWSNSFNLRRSSINYKKKYFTDPASCGAIAVKCKLTSGVKDKDIDKLREAGLKIDEKDIVESNGKKYLKGMSYVNAQKKTVRVTATNFVSTYRSDPLLLSKFEYVASMKGITWRGKQALKKFALFKVKRTNPIGEGTTQEENVKNMREVQYGEGDSDTNKAKGGVDEDGNEAGNKAGIDQYNSDLSEQSQQLREKALADGPDANDISITDGLNTNDAKKLTKIAFGTLKSTAKKTLTGAIGTIDTYCSIYQQIRIVSYGAKLYKARALIKYAGIFMTLADQAKAGKITPAQASFVGSLLVSKSVADNSKGKTFSDSDGYTLVTQGKVGSIGGLARFTNGTPALQALDTVKKVLDTGGASPTTCKQVKSWYGQAGLIAAGVAVSIGTLGANAAAGAVLGAVEGAMMGIIGEYLTPWMIQFAAGVIAPDPEKDPEKGYGVGNAIAAGMGAFGSQIGRANGLRYVKKSEFKSFLADANQSEATLAAAEEINNPTNPTDTFTNNVASALMPLSTSLRSFDLAQFATSIATLPSSILSSTASAANADNYRGDLCDDEDYKQQDIATDAFCNPILAQSTSDIDSAKYDPNAVIDYMLGNNYIDQEGNPLGDYGTFLSTCIDGDEPITADGYSADLSTASTKDCVSNDDKFQYFRFFTADTNILDAQDAGVEGTLGAPLAGSGNLSGDLVVMTYNVLGINHAADYKGRADKVAETVAAKSPDIIGFQELAQDRQSDYFQEKLGSEYAVFDGKSARGIFYKKSKFTLMDSGEYSVQRYCESTHFPWVKLSMSGSPIYVFNVHPSANGPNHPECNGSENGRGNDDGPSSRKKAISKMLDEMKSIVKEPDAPVFITGDFNSGKEKRSKDGNAPESDLPYSLITSDGFKSTLDVAPTKINADYNTSHGGLNSQNKGHNGLIDFVYFKGANINAVSWENVINSTTNGASDHSPVVATFDLGGAGDATQTGTGDVSADGLAWVLGKSNYDKYKAYFHAEHYAGGGFLGNSNSSVDISWGGIEGRPVYAILGGTVIKQPLGRATYKCTGSPNVGNNGGLMIESNFNGQKIVFAYAHGKNVQFKEGQTVKAGQQIMQVGNVGNSCGAHLHMDGTVNGKNFCLQDLFTAMEKGGAVNFTSLASKANATCSGK